MPIVCGVSNTIHVRVAGVCRSYFYYTRDPTAAKAAPPQNTTEVCRILGRLGGGRTKRFCMPRPGTQNRSGLKGELDLTDYFI